MFAVALLTTTVNDSKALITWTLPGNNVLGWTDVAGDEIYGSFSFDSGAGLGAFDVTNTRNDPDIGYVSASTITPDPPDLLLNSTSESSTSMFIFIAARLPDAAPPGATVFFEAEENILTSPDSTLPSVWLS